MRNLGLFCTIACALLGGARLYDIKLGDNTAVLFATVDEGKQILSAQDDFIRRLSPFDRAARLKTDKDVSETEFLNFVCQNILAWTDDEKQNLQSILSDIQPQLKSLSLPLPKTIYLIKTTGNEEGHAAYTRANAIILPKNKLEANTATIKTLICHELFHILSRADPELREQLYGIIGFTKCNEIDFPPELNMRKITNPDAPINDHYINLQYDRKTVWAVPVLFSMTDKYDVAHGGEFFNYLQFQFLLVERGDDSPDFKPVYEGNSPKLVDIENVSGFFEQVGKNSEYIIHPEEILADNFALLLMEEQDVPSPQILKKMKNILIKDNTSK